jgi:hypothetical protein
MRPTALFVVSVVASSALAQNVVLRTGDGLALGLTTSGRVQSLSIGGTKLPLKSEGGFALADFHNQPTAQNLAPNPGFEQGAEGWGLAAGQAIDTDVFHDGKASVRLDVPGPEAGGSNVGCVVPVKPNTRYRVGLWLRRHDVGVCGAYASERDDQGKLTGKATQVGVAIPQEDDVWLPLSWEVTTEPATTRLSLRADIYRSTGTLWLDDFSIVGLSEGVFEPVSGKVETGEGRATLRGALPEAGLELEAAFVGGPECIRVDGQVRDSTGKDRAVAMRFALPLDLAGWTWYNDAEERRTIEPGSPFRHTYDCESGIGRCSIYPWSALTGPAGGLSLALPLSQGPRVFLLQHDQRAPETSLTLYFGLTRDAGENPGLGPFSFVLYRHDPAWGMRSAMERYYRLFPESFVKRPVYEGYLNYADLEPYDPKTHKLGSLGGGADDASDFGEGYRFLWHVHGCYDFRMIPSDDPKMPSDEAVRSLLGQMVEDERTKPRYYVPTDETLKKLVYDAEGHIRYIGDTQYWRAQEGYNRTDTPGWGLNFRVDEDPGVSSFLADETRRRLAEYARDPGREPFSACLTADAIEGYFANSGGLDYRREHFATTTVPLTFGKDSLKVALPNTIWDLLHEVWWPLTQEYQVVTYGNANGYEQAFTMPFCDIPMVEWEWDPGHPDRFERYLRAVAYQKIWRYWRVCGRGEKDHASVLRHFHRCLASGVYPCVGELREVGGDLERYRALFRQYVPAIEELSTAGWEPVPYARATEGVVVERFGTYARGDLYLTLRNYADQAKDALVRLDRAPLGIPPQAALVAEDVLPGSPSLLAVGPELHAQVEPDGARAFWIGTREQAARRGLRLAVATLGKIGRLFASELTDPHRQALGRALEVARLGGEDPLRAAEEMQALVADLDRLLETSSPVDKGKLLFRLRAELSRVPVAMLGIGGEAERILPNALRGQPTSVSWKVTNSGKVPLAELTARAASLWPEVTDACRVSPVPATQAPGTTATLQAQLFVPAAPPRPLMPYLLELRGSAGQTPFTVAVPVDVTVGAAVEVGVAPRRAFRGQERSLAATVTNHLAQAGSLEVRFAPPPKAKVTPADMRIDVPAAGRSEVALSLSLDPDTPIGELRLPFAVSSEDARFNTEGAVSLSVADPVPRARVRRVSADPVIDGRLQEPEWQAPPTVEELRLLAGGGPAAEKTAVWLAYSDRALYIVFRCRESQMGRLRATFTERGSPLYLDDDVEVFLLPPDAAQAFQFAVNALGTQSDNFGNKAGWRAAAQRDADGWTVEMIIPYAVVEATAPRPGIPWAMQLGRQEKPRGETTAWTPGPAFSVPESFGEVAFE